MPKPTSQVPIAHRQWMAVYTAPRHEKQVSQQLQQRSVECFLPLYESVRRWKTGPVRIQLPLFPSYLFIHLEVQERRKVIDLPSVVSIVGNRSGPATLPDSEIEQLRQSVATGQAQPHRYLTAGTRVRIIRGALTGGEGILVRKKGCLKVVISVHLLMQSVAVEVDACDVEPCVGPRSTTAAAGACSGPVQKR